jgi:4-hydroxybenzoate polyprenyltransferase
MVVVELLTSMVYMVVLVLVLVEAYLVFRYWIIIIAAIVIAVVFIRRQRKAKQKILISESGREALDDEGVDEDIESLIDDGKKRTNGDSQV